MQTLTFFLILFCFCIFSSCAQLPVIMDDVCDITQDICFYTQEICNLYQNTSLDSTAVNQAKYELLQIRDNLRSVSINNSIIPPSFRTTRRDDIRLYLFQELTKIKEIEEELKAGN